MEGGGCRDTDLTHWSQSDTYTRDRRTGPSSVPPGSETVVIHRDSTGVETSGVSCTVCRLPPFTEEAVTTSSPVRPVDTDTFIRPLGPSSVTGSEKDTSRGVRRTSLRTYLRGQVGTPEVVGEGGPPTTTRGTEGFTTRKRLLRRTKVPCAVRGRTTFHRETTTTV